MAASDYSKYKKYKNLISGNEVIFLNQIDNAIYVEYIDSKNKTTYSVEYFDRTFNPVIEES